MPDCPVNYNCTWSQVLVGPKVPDQGDWTPMLIAIVVTVLIITVGLLTALFIDEWYRHRMEFKVK